MSLKSPYSKKVYQQNAKLYKVLANPVRLELLNTIKDQEATVDELSALLGIRKSNTSQHLSILKYLNLVKTRRDGKNIYYTLTDPQLVEPCRIMKVFWEQHRIHL